MKLVKGDQSVEELMNPSSGAWKGAGEEKVSLAAIPLDAQPNRYIRTSWKNKTFGGRKEVNASAIESGDSLYIRLQWQDDGPSPGEFAHAAGVFTGKGKSISSMGSEKEPLSLWYWAEDRNQGVYASALGPGVFARSTEKPVNASVKREDKKVSVVLSGPARDVDGQIGVALWDGSNDERAGLGSVSGWVKLEK